MQNLNKDNFFNEMMQRYPNATKLFCDWIDNYKKEVNWNQLFNSDSDYQNADGKNAPAPKFHELPYEMQFGIIFRFFAEQVKDIKDAYVDVETLHSQLPESLKEIEIEIASKVDWPEDFTHENGNYSNLCCHCQRLFKGHKRRVECKACATPIN